MVTNYFKNEMEQDRKRRFTAIFTQLINQEEEYFSLGEKSSIIEEVDNQNRHQGGDRND